MRQAERLRRAAFDFMILDLRGKKVVVIGGKQSVGRAIAEAVARKGADVVIWLRKDNGEMNGANVLSLTHPEIPVTSPNGVSQMSLWRQTIARRTYW
jgi:NAD(P)-dependent dehydrogenase (short-subunit alcohol dehydrogenase family)